MSSPVIGPPAPDETPDQSALASIIRSMTQGQTPPVSAPSDSPFDLASMVRQVTQLPEYQRATGSMEDIAGRQRDIESQIGSMPVPQTAPRNKLVRALAGLTGPGRAIESAIYEPGMREYGAKQKALAEQLAALKQQESVPTEELRSLAQMTGQAGLGMYRGGELANAAERNRIRQEQTQAYTQNVQNKLRVALAGLDLNAIRTGSQVELNRAIGRLANVRADLAPNEQTIQVYGIDSASARAQAIANVTAQLGIDRTHPVAQMIDSILGTGLTPSAPQTPAGAQPERGPQPLPKKPAGGAGKTPAKPTAPAGKKGDPLGIL